MKKLIVICLAISIVSCSRETNFLKEIKFKDFHVSNVKVFPNKVKKAVLNSEKKSNISQSNELVNQLVLPELKELFESIDRIEITDDLVVYYSKDGNVIDQTTYKVLTETEGEVVMEIKGRQYKMTKQSNNSWKFDTGFASFTLN